MRQEDETVLVAEVEQIEVAGRYQRDWETQHWMLVEIARRGEPANRALLPCLKGERCGVTRYHAAVAMGFIHGWGYDLNGSEAARIIDTMAGGGSSNQARLEILFKPAGRCAGAYERRSASFLEERRRGIP